MSKEKPELNEDGYTRIAHPILEAIAKITIPTEARRVLDVIIRLTYGWQESQAPISQTEFSKRTGIDRRNISRAIKKLREMNLIICRMAPGSDTLSYGVNKYHETWRGVVGTDDRGVVSVDDRGASVLTTGVSSAQTTANSGNGYSDKELLIPKDILKDTS